MKKTTLSFLLTLPLLMMGISGCASHDSNAPGNESVKDAILAKPSGPLTPEQQKQIDDGKAQTAKALAAQNSGAASGAALAAKQAADAKAASQGH